MKKLILSTLMTAGLLGCANADFRAARDNANKVENGMTVQQVTTILGMPPTDVSENIVKWRRGNAQSYSGLRTGSLEFKLRDGRVVDVPPGGILSDAAVAQVQAERKARWDQEAKESAERQARENEEKAKQQAVLEAKRQQDEAAAAIKRKHEIEREVIAREESRYICKDKITCGKVFALAQIYAREHSDMKIQVATDTIVDTYNPTEDGKIGISIVKAPRSGTSELILITPTCKGENGSYETICRSKRTRIYAGFRSFIESNLAK